MAQLDDYEEYLKAIAEDLGTLSIVRDMAWASLARYRESQAYKARKAWEAIKNIVWDNGAGDLDYDDFIETGEAVGLLVEVPYDPRLHGQELLDWGSDPGDLINIDPYDHPQGAQ